MVPGRPAPVTVTAVPSGSDPDVHPLVLVAAPVPEQCAACPMNTSAPATNTKFAVHCAPLVNVCTPGCTAALAAGAQVGAAPADSVSPISATAAAPTATASLHRVPITPTSLPGPATTTCRASALVRVVLPASRYRYIYLLAS